MGEGFVIYFLSLQDFIEDVSKWFHGVFYFLQMGSSECRAMDERALAFLKTHTDTLMVLDAKEYGMEAVPASVRAYLDPVLFYAMNCELRAARGKVFDHDPDFRRYMGVVEY